MSRLSVTSEGSRSGYIPLLHQPVDGKFATSAHGQTLQAAMIVVVWFAALRWVHRFLRHRVRPGWHALTIAYFSLSQTTHRVVISVASTGTGGHATIDGSSHGALRVRRSPGAARQCPPTGRVPRLALLTRTPQTRPPP
jgi:hypothetical protein